MPNSFIPLLAQRIPNSNDFRDTMMARRWTQKEGLAMGLLDDVVELEKLMDRATEVALREAPKVAPGPWGFIKVCLNEEDADDRNNHIEHTSMLVNLTDLSNSLTCKPRLSGRGIMGLNCRCSNYACMRLKLQTIIDILSDN